MHLALALAATGASACGAQATEPGTRSGTFVSDAATLSYSMDVPAGRGPFPVVVFVHGSGRTARDEMRNLVEPFLGRGYMVFRYDKRGVGASTGTYEGVGPFNSLRVIPQLARDAAAAFATACAAPDVERERCGFFGASQAGWVIVEALSAVPQAKFGVIFSGTTASVGREIAFSTVAETGGGTLDSAYRAISTFTGTEGYDPMLALSRIRTPMLWLLGLDDRSIPSRTTAAHLKQLATAGLPLTVAAYEQYGHALGPLVWPEIDRFLAARAVSR